MSNLLLTVLLPNFEYLGDPYNLIFIAVVLFTVLYHWGLFLISRRLPPVDGPFEPDLHFVFVIPSLNEELVIGRTLEHLLALKGRNVHILVINDDSDDRTREIALSYHGDGVEVIDHPKSMARQGKGAALNYAFNYLMSSELVKSNGAEKVIIGVIDADGRVDDNIIEAVNPYFSNSHTGAVQVAVRITNATANSLTRWQEFEFVTFARIAQKAREQLGSVGLGGNGQFVRMSALASLGSEPWSDCLTEDLDLGLRILVSGLQNHYCPDTFVSQQAIPKLKPLIRQRTRWYQGHVTCWKHIPKILNSDRKNRTKLDVIYYLLAPLLVFLFLPCNVIFFVWFFYLISSGSFFENPSQFIALICFWYIFSFGAMPPLIWTFAKDDKDMSLWRAYLWSHLFALYYNIWLFAGIKAINRLAHGQTGWSKTARTEEATASGHPETTGSASPQEEPL